MPFYDFYCKVCHILNEDEFAVQAFIKQARNSFKGLPVEDVAFPRGVNNL